MSPSSVTTRCGVVLVLRIDVAIGNRKTGIIRERDLVLKEKVIIRRRVHAAILAPGASTFALTTRKETATTSGEL